MPDLKTEDAGGFTVVPDDGQVTQLKVDHRFSILLAGGIELVLEGPFLLYQPGEQTPTEVPTGDVWEVEPALPLFRDQVERVVARRSGELYVMFSSGRRIEEPTNLPWENYQVLFPDGTMWVGSAGGGLVTFPPPTSNVRTPHTDSPRL
jgi:hypothetical protein